MKLWRCSICRDVGLWGPTWGCYSNIVVDDEFPSLRLVTCSPVCMKSAESKLANGSIVFPVIKLRGPLADLKRQQVGYDPQPEQRILIEIWNAQHPNDQLAMQHDPFTKRDVLRGP